MRRPLVSLTLLFGSAALGCSAEPSNTTDDDTFPPLVLQVELGEEAEAIIDQNRRVLYEATWKDIDASTGGDGMGGATIAIGLHGELVWSESYGWADSGAEITADEHTRYRLASISKLFTTAMFLQQVDEGLVDLDDPVAELVPEILNVDGPDPGAITWRHVLSHRGGFPWHHAIWTARIGSADDWEARFLASMDGLALNAAPGEAYDYSNSGQTLAGIATGRLDGTSYEEAFQERTVERLGLAETTLNFEGESGPEWARGYDRTMSIEEPSSADFSTELILPEYAVPAHRMHSSAADLVRLAHALEPADGGYVSPAAFANMTADATEPFPDDFAGWFYGLGTWHTLDSDGSEVINHPGDWPGFATTVYLHPDTGLSLILLRNYTESSLDQHEYCWPMFQALVAELDGA